MIAAVARVEAVLDRAGLALMSPWAAVAVQIVAAVAAIGAALLLEPDGDGLVFLGAPLTGVCGFRAANGIPCPTCGATRAWVHAVRGHLGAAVRYNAPCTLLFGVIVAGGVLGLVRIGRRDPRWARMPLPIVGIAAVGWAILLYGAWYGRVHGLLPALPGGTAA